MAHTASYTSYNTDEVHDTRSYFIGYYRGPRKDDTDDEDSEVEEFYKNLVNKPEEAREHLESNIATFPDTVKSVSKVELGKEHVIAMVIEQSNEKCLYGIGSNQWGQLGRDPLRQPFVEKL